MWRLPYTTHSSLLPGISNTIPLIDLLYRRFLKVCVLMSKQSIVPLPNMYEKARYWKLLVDKTSQYSQNWEIPIWELSSCF